MSWTTPNEEMLSVRLNRTDGLGQYPKSESIFQGHQKYGY